MQTLEAGDMRLPAIGLGTVPLKTDADVPVVADAIRAGYRLIDTAAFYRNEELVGDAVRASGVPRHEIAVTTKVWPDALARDAIRASVEGSIERLNTGPIDLLLAHWPNPALPMAEVMGGLNDMIEAGLAAHIGVSNFTAAMLDEAVAVSAAPIVCNQIEIHPYLFPSITIEACRRHRIAVVAHCPLGRAAAFDEPALQSIAGRHAKSVAQAILRWHIQQQIIPIPGSHDPARLSANLDVFDFELSDEEMAAIGALSSRRLRHCTPMVDGLVWDPV